MRAIRPLTVRDRDFLTEIIKKFVSELGSNELLKLMVSDPQAPQATSEEDPNDKRYALLVIEIIKRMIDVTGNDLRGWFASLIGCSIEEFLDLPIDTEIDILEQLVEMENSNRFFSRLLALASKIKASANAYGIKSDA